MSQTTIEYLFHVTAPHGERGLGAPPRRAEPPLFSDQLSQASAPTGIDLKGLGPRVDAADYSRPESGSRADDSARSDVPDLPADSPSTNSANTNDGNTDARDGATSADANDAAAASGEAAALKNTHDEGANDPAGEEMRDDADASAVTAAEAASHIAGAAVVADTGSSAIVNIPTDIDAAATAQPMANGQTNEQPSNGEALSLSRSLTLHETDGFEPTLDAIAQSSEHAENTHSIARPKADAQAGSDEISSTAPSNQRARRDTQAGTTVAATAGNGKAAATTGGAVEAQGKPEEELPANSTVEEEGTSADNARRASSSRATSRSVARADAAANATATAVAAVANGPASQGGEAATRAEDLDEGNQQAAKAAATKVDALVASLARTQRGTAVAHRGARAAKDDDVPRVDAARFVGRVAKAFQTAHDRGGTLQLRLSPPELGSLRLELTVKDGALTAALETESATARRVLLDHLPALRDRLAEQNIRVERFDVDVRRDGSGGQANDREAQQQQQQPSDQPPSRRRPATPARAAQTSSPDAPAVQSRINNSEINLVA